MAQITGLRKADERRDPFERQIGLGQQLPHPLHLHAADFRLRSAAEDIAKPALEARARQARLLDDLPDREPVAGPLSDQPQRRRKLWIVDGEDVGALPRGDAERRHQNLLRPGFPGSRGAGTPPRHQLLELLGRAIAYLFGIGPHARQGRIAQFAEERVVVDADHTHLLRHRQAGPSRGVDDVLSAQVVARQHGQRRSEALQPGLEPLLARLPFRRVRAEPV